MTKRKKFLSLYESYITRFERGGFLVGDIFKFHDNFKSLDEYKQLGQNVKDLIDQMIDSGLHVRVVGIKDTTSPIYPGNPQTSSLQVILTLALDNGGGRYTHIVAVPCCLGQPDPQGVNLPSIPDAVRRKDRVNIKPKEMKKGNNVSNKTDRGNRKLTDTNMSLPTKNTVIPSKPVTPSPSVASQTKSYTEQYVTGSSAVISEQSKEDAKPVSSVLNYMSLTR
jgi:hypothetical protein